MGVTVTFDFLVYQNHFEDKVTLLSFGEQPITNQFVVLSEKKSVLRTEAEAFTQICQKYF